MVEVPVERLLLPEREPASASVSVPRERVVVVVPVERLFLSERVEVVVPVLRDDEPVLLVEALLREPEVVVVVPSLRDPEVVVVEVPSLRGVVLPVALLRVGVVAPLRPVVRDEPVVASPVELLEPVWRPEVVDVRVPEVWLLPVCGAFVVTLTPPSLLLTVGRFTPGVQGAVGLGAGVCGGRL